MGYCVDKIGGSPITLNKAGYTKLAGLLDRVEANSNIGGHISWCDPLEVLRKEYGPGYELDLVVKVLEDYGFLLHYDGNIADELVIVGWGGDKIGSSWDPMWDAIGDVVDEPVKWLIRGEDNEVWVEYCLPGVGRKQVLVDLDELLNKAFIEI